MQHGRAEHLLAHRQLVKIVKAACGSTRLRRIESFREDWHPVELERTKSGWKAAQQINRLSALVCGSQAESTLEVVCDGRE